MEAFMSGVVKFTRSRTEYSSWGLPLIARRHQMSYKLPGDLHLQRARKIRYSKGQGVVALEAHHVGR